MGDLVHPDIAEGRTGTPADEGTTATEGAAPGSAGQEAPTPWEALLSDTKAIGWHGLSDGQKNLKASQVLQRFPAVTAVLPHTRPAGSQDQETGARLQIWSHEELKTAMQVLLCLANHVPERQLAPLVAKRIFSRSAPVSFKDSDTRARAIMLSTGFAYLRVLLSRQGDTESTVCMLLDMITDVSDEYEELCDLYNQPLTLMGSPEAVVGGTAVPGSRTHEDWIERLAVIRTAMRANQELLSIALAHTEVQITNSIQGSREFLSESIARLVEARRPYPPVLRRRVFCIIRASILAIYREKALGEGAAAGQRRETVTEATQALQNLFWVPIESILTAEYPIRQGLTAQPADTPLMRDEAFQEGLHELSEAAIHALGAIAALNVLCGRTTWEEVEAEAARPYGTVLFWSCANSLYRGLALRFLSVVVMNLQQHGYTAHTQVLSSLLKVWVLAMLDPTQTKAQAQVTLALVKLEATAKYLDCPREAHGLVDALKRDSDGCMRAQWVASCLSRAAKDSRLGALIHTWPVEVTTYFQARMKEMQQISREECVAWRARFCNAVAACLTCDPGMLQLLNRPVRVQAGTMLSAFLRLLIAQVVEHVLHGVQRGPLLDLESDEFILELGAARQALRGSPVKHLGEVLWILAVMRSWNEKDPVVTQELHLLCTALVETLPGEPGFESAAGMAQLELFADGLLSSGSRAGGQGLGHYVLGTYCRRWLMRSSYRNSSCPRQAISALRLLRCLLAPEGGRSDALLRTYLPQVLLPFIHVLQPESEPASPAAAAELFRFVPVMLAAMPALPTCARAKAVTQACIDFNRALLLASHPVEQEEFLNAVAVLLDFLCCAAACSIVCQVDGGESPAGVLGSLRNRDDYTGFADFTASRTWLFRLLGRPFPSMPVEQQYQKSALALASHMPSGYPSAGDGATAALHFLAALGSISEAGKAWVLQVLAPIFQLLDARGSQHIGLSAKYQVMVRTMGLGSEWELSPQVPASPAPPLKALRSDAGRASPSAEGEQSGSREVREFAGLQGLAGREVAVVAQIRDRDPRRGTKPLKTQQHVVTLTLTDEEGHMGKMLCTGSTALRIAGVLDADTCGLFKFNPVRVFIRKDTGKAMLQGLSRTHVERL